MTPIRHAEVLRGRGVPDKEHVPQHNKDNKTKHTFQLGRPKRFHLAIGRGEEESRRKAKRGEENKEEQKEG